MSTNVEESIEVNLPVSTVYNQWTQFEDFPQFMSGITSVTQLGDDRLEWVAEIAGELDTDDAVAISERLVVVSATPLSRKRHGDALTLAARWADAEQAYDAALALDPSFTPAINGKAESIIAHYEAELRLDDSLRARAIELWKQSLKLDPNQPTVTEQLAQWEAPRRFR